MSKTDPIELFFVGMEKLGTRIHAVDVYEPFLKDLARHAQEAGLEHLVQTHCMDMKDIPKTFHDIDLLWAEGSVGFSAPDKALRPSADSTSPDI